MKKNSPFFFPQSYGDPYNESVVFSGDLTDYHRELLENMHNQGKNALLVDGLWEIPQLVGFDADQKVICLVVRISAQDDCAESEFMIASTDQQWIMHINAYETEEEFFSACFRMIRANLAAVHWESFMYDEQGRYTGQLVVESLEESSQADQDCQEMIEVDRDSISGSDQKKI